MILSYLGVLISLLNFKKMPNSELISTQLEEASSTVLLGYLQLVVNALKAFTHDLSPEERQKYGSINEQNKLLVGKVMEYQTNAPDLSSPQVNWVLFKQHWTTRTGLARLEDTCQRIIEMCSDPRILHDYALYQSSLTDYDYTKYRAGSNSSDGGVFTTKMEELRQFFPTGGGNPSSPAPAAE